MPDRLYCSTLDMQAQHWPLDRGSRQACCMPLNTLRLVLFQQVCCTRFAAPTHPQLLSPTLMSTAAPPSTPGGLKGRPCSAAHYRQWRRRAVSPTSPPAAAPLCACSTAIAQEELKQIEPEVSRAVSSPCGMHWLQCQPAEQPAVCMAHIWCSIRMLDSKTLSLSVVFRASCTSRLQELCAAIQLSMSI